jgi:hypothetical protein
LRTVLRESVRRVSLNIAAEARFKTVYYVG